MVGGERVFESLSKPSWLTLDRFSFNKFVEFIYPQKDVSSVDKAWQLLSDGEYWQHDNEYRIISRLININGIALMIWIGAYYFVDMVAEVLSFEA